MVWYNSPFKSAKEAKEKIDKYFNKCEKDGKPLTITGLALALGYYDRSGLYKASQRDDEAGHLIKVAKGEVEASVEVQLLQKNSVGAIFWLKNHNWIDKVENSNPGLESTLSQILIGVNERKRTRQLGEVPDQPIVVHPTDVGTDTATSKTDLPTPG